MKRMMMCVLAGVMCGVLTGCLGFASSTKMASDVEPTYAPPTPLVAGEPRGKEAIVGEWEGTVYVNAKVVIPSLRYVRDSRSARLRKMTFKFFEDGKFMSILKDQNGKETLAYGDWSYESGILTMSAKKDNAEYPSTPKRILWYEDTLIELRLEDLAAYETLFKNGNIESAKAWYEPDGSLRTHLEIVNKGTHASMKMIESPVRLKRIGDVE